MPEGLTPGFWELSEWGVLEITGPDSRDFLNRLSTRDFRVTEPGRTRLGGFLTGKSTVVALGFFQEDETSVWFIADPISLQAASEHIEKFHFAEQMQVHYRSTEFGIFALQKAPAEALAGAMTWTDSRLAGITFLRLPASQRDAALARWKGMGLKALAPDLFTFALVRAGFPRVGREIGDTVLILEADLERAVDRNKGCYPGQEVVERIFTYGQVNRRLFPVQIDGSWKDAKLPLKFTLEGKPAAFLVCAMENPAKAGDVRGLAFVYRSFWEYPGTMAESGVQMRVSKGTP